MLLKLNINIQLQQLHEEGEKVKIVVLTHSSYSHIKAIQEFLDELVIDNEVYCFLDKDYDSFCRNEKINYKFYNENCEKECNKIIQEHNKMLWSYIDPNEKKGINELLIEVEKPLEYMLSGAKVYEKYLLPLIQEINPDLIIRDACALYGRFIADKLNVKLIGYATSMIYNHDHLINNPREILSGYFHWNLDHFMDDEVQELLLKTEEITLNLCKKFNVRPFSPLCTTDPGEEFNFCFGGTLLQPELNESNTMIVQPMKFKNIRDFNDSKENVILISSGTVGVNKMTFYNYVINAFANTDYEVIIGFHYANAPFIKTKTLPNNIRIESFVNQEDILRKAKLFITHGGYNSILESLYYDVPILVNPLMSEQFLNAQQISEKQIGINLKTYPINSNSLYSISKFLIENDDLKENIKLIKHNLEESHSVKYLVSHINSLNEGMN
ncbi:hypothetical protein COE09_26610 [Bacillus thuringiensis]|nr:hypothetical protein COE09_26610 [Bacillus thuringiensis]